MRTFTNFETRKQKKNCLQAATRGAAAHAASAEAVRAEMRAEAEGLVAGAMRRAAELEDAAKAKVGDWADWVGVEAGLPFK